MLRSSVLLVKIFLFNQIFSSCRISTPLAAALVLSLFGLGIPGYADPPQRHILIVKSRDNAFYSQTQQGFVDGLKTRGYSTKDAISLDVIALTGDADKDQQIVQEHLHKSSDLIFTLGTDATRAIYDAHPKSSVLFSMILDPVSLGVVKSLAQPGGSFTGTTLLVDPGKQFDALQQADPHIQRIGVLYTADDATSLAFLSQAQQEAKKLNIEIIAKPIQDPKETVRPILEQLAGQVDAFWLILDPASAGSRALRDTLEVAQAHHLPVLGTSAAHAHAGALVALSANLRDLGDVNAEMAVPLLEGTSSAAQMSVRSPRQTILSVNLVAAAALGIKVPYTLLHLADEVIDADTPAQSGK
ncbi:MAG: ABC transporter substrate-binding protein [Janthinobacterium lividum]